MQRLQKTFFSTVVLFMAICTNSFADNITTQHTDSIIIQADTAAASIYKDIDNIIDSTKVETSVNIVDIATNEINKLDVKTFKPSSKKAIMYSAIFPGLGQIYNGKYWKLPILYGGFVGLSYAITWNNSHYQDYFGAYKDILDDNPNTNSWHNFVPYGQDPKNIDKNWFTGVLKDRKNYFRYYRDLSVIIGVALYGLGIVDAYVDAQLFEFDVSPDLSLKIEPVLMQRNSSNNFIADSFGFKCSFSF